jgi:glucose/mannose-6-phosphate isomerase
VTVDDVLAYPHQIGDALWRIEAAGLSRTPAGTVAVCGPSGGAGALAALAGADARDGLGSEGDALVLCVSYSGDDQEALACFEEAGKRGAPRAVVCTAGTLAARAREEGVPVIGVPAGLPGGGAIVYFLLAALYCAGYPVEAEAEPAAATLSRLAEEWGAKPPPGPVSAGGTPLERVLAEVFRRDLEAAYAAAGDDPDG